MKKAALIFVLTICLAGCNKEAEEPLPETTEEVSVEETTAKESIQIELEPEYETITLDDSDKPFNEQEIEAVPIVENLTYDILKQMSTSELQAMCQSQLASLQEELQVDYETLTEEGWEEIRQYLIELYFPDTDEDGVTIHETEEMDTRYLEEPVLTPEIANTTDEELKAFLYHFYAYYYPEESFDFEQYTVEQLAKVRKGLAELAITQQSENQE